MARTRRGRTVEIALWGIGIIIIGKAIGDASHTGRLTIPGTDITLLNLSKTIPIGAGREDATADDDAPPTSAPVVAPVVAPVAMPPAGGTVMMPEVPRPPAQTESESAFPPAPADAIRASAVDLQQYGVPGYGWNGWHVFHIDTARRTNNQEGVVGVARTVQEAAATARLASGSAPTGRG